MNIPETALRADRVQTQCQTCPLNLMEAGVVVRIKKLCASPEIQTRLREIGFCEEQIIRLVTTQTNYICQVCNMGLANAGSVVIGLLSTSSEKAISYVSSSQHDECEPTSCTRR